MKLYCLLFTLIGLWLVCDAAGVQDECPRICTMDYRPVCGSDGVATPRLFSNMCQLKSFNCAKKTSYVAVSRGMCPS